MSSTGSLMVSFTYLPISFLDAYFGIPHPVIAINYITPARINNRFFIVFHLPVLELRGHMHQRASLLLAPTHIVIQK
jgi:hypothetical protein